MTKFAFVTKISHENSHSTSSYQSGMLSFFRKKAWAYLFRAIYDHLLDFTSSTWQIFVTVFETDARCSRIKFSALLWPFDTPFSKERDEVTE